ncbi:MAG: enoyl-CoA hydratase/isomerase family protein [Thermodesulfobacteriota bacterium]
MSYETITFNADTPVATLAFNRPKALNALNTQLLHEVLAALDEVEANEDIRVLILTGTGEKAFVAGADIGEINELNPVAARFFSKNGHRVMDRLQKLPIPVIAAVNGFALGGGLEMALACDFIYASENAKLGLPEINLGIIPGFGGTQRLARLVGKSLAKEMIFTGKMIDAAEGAQKGLVNKVVSADELMAEVTKVAETMASKGKVALFNAKQAVNDGTNADLATGCEIETQAFSLCIASPDAREGTRAFLEKRQPEFKGGRKG